MFILGYVEENFITLQYSVDKAIILAAGGNMSQMDNIDVSMRRIPYPPYIDDKYLAVIQTQLPLLLMLSFIYYAMQIVKELVIEKETSLKVSVYIIFN